MSVNKLIKMTLGAALCAAASTTFAAPVELIVNGSFEANVQAAGTWNIYNNLTGWTGGAKGIELRDNVAGVAYAGNNFIELDTTGNSAASQSVATTLGQAYTLSFAYSPRAGVLADSNGIKAFWNGKDLGLFTGNGIHNAGNVWNVYTKTVHGNGALSTLQFQAFGKSDSYGGSLDAVSLTSAVPEPETFGMLLVGMGLIGLVSRRRRNDKFSA